MVNAVIKSDAMIRNCQMIDICEGATCCRFEYYTQRLSFFQWREKEIKNKKGMVSRLMFASINITAD